MATSIALERMKFWIVKPKEGVNYIYNPTFASPEKVAGWTAYGAGVTIAASSLYQRRGIYSMEVKTASGMASGAYYGNLSVTTGYAYTFSCDVKGVAGRTMYIAIANSAGVIKQETSFTATGSWNRYEVTYTATETSSTYRVYVVRDAAASIDLFYVDGVQFEQSSTATTLIEGYAPGCRWTGMRRNSPSERSAQTGLGGELICISDYAAITKHVGFGMGQFNQVTTEMSVGGDLYQGHTLKSRTVALNLAYTGSTHGELQAKRKVILDALRPDYLSNVSVPESYGINAMPVYRGHEQRILRYQGFDAEGNEATNPIDIVCVFQSCHTNTPDTETSQQDTLLFTVPSGLFQGAYEEGSTLGLYADFPANYIVKQDRDGNWCRWNGSAYESLIDGLPKSVKCMVEGPDGKIYIGGNFTNAGGIANADYLCRWNPVTEAYEAVVAGINDFVFALAFDADGSLYVGGYFTDLGSAYGDGIVKIAHAATTPTIVALGTGVQGTVPFVYSIVVAPNGDVYAGGSFETAGGVTGTAHVARWDGTKWNAMATGLNNYVVTMVWAPSKLLYLGGSFTNADGSFGDYLCYWDGAYFHEVGVKELNAELTSVAVDQSGRLVIGGYFANAGDVANADYLARWHGGSHWEAFGTGVNGVVEDIFCAPSGEIYVCGIFTEAGGIAVADQAAVWKNGTWMPLDIALPGTAYVSAVMRASDGSLYMGGAFSTTGSGENAESGLAENVVTVGASANTYPIISVTGPGKLNSIINYSTGKSILFNDLTLQPGEWISLSFDPVNIQFNAGWPSRGNLIGYVVAGSDFSDFYLKPGENTISVFMDKDTVDSNTAAAIFWRPKFWSIDGALL